MRNNRPRWGPNYNECAIVNLDIINGRGTYWVVYTKYGDSKSYFHSFGNLVPPIELTRYFHRGSTPTPKIIFNYNKYGEVW